MKALLIAVLAGIMSGCAENTPPAAEVRQQFERGITGHGRLVPLDDPAKPIPPPESRPQ